MAKTRSILNISGTLDGITHVNSAAYGTHARAKRGTYTQVKLSPGMKASSSAQTQANLMAKIIFDSVNAFVPKFKNGVFWSRLVSSFRKQKNGGNVYSYDGLDGFEMRQDYPISRHGFFNIKKVDGSLTLNYHMNVNMDYRASILRIATDETLLLAYPEEIIEVNIVESKPEGLSELNFTTLPKGSPVLYVLLCDQLINGEPTGWLKGRSVRFFSGNAYEHANQ